MFGRHAARVARSRPRQRVAQVRLSQPPPQVHPAADSRQPTADSFSSSFNALLTMSTFESSNPRTSMRSPFKDALASSICALSRTKVGPNAVDQHSTDRESASAPWMSSTSNQDLSKHTKLEHLSATSSFMTPLRRRSSSIAFTRFWRKNVASHEFSRSIDSIYLRLGSGVAQEDQAAYNALASRTLWRPDELYMLSSPPGILLYFTPEADVTKASRLRRCL